LAFVTVLVVDKRGLTVPYADSSIRFEIDGPGEIVATDNGDPSDLTPFPSRERKAFHGLCLVIVRGAPGKAGTLELTAKSDSLASGTVTLRSVAHADR
jgi:beta-galactosidase